MTRERERDEDWPAERERQIYIHITFQSIHEDSLLFRSEIDRSFLLEEIIVFQRGTWIELLFVRGTPIDRRTLQRERHSPSDHSLFPYLHIVFVMNLQFTGENVAHHQDVVLFVIDS